MLFSCLDIWGEIEYPLPISFEIHVFNFAKQPYISLSRSFMTDEVIPAICRI